MKEKTTVFALLIVLVLSVAYMCSKKNMSYVLVNRPVVVLEIDDIVESYIDINRRLAFDFSERLEQAKKLILNFLFALQIKYKNVQNNRLDAISLSNTLYCY